MSTQDWYYLTQGQRSGPVSSAMLRQLAQQGAITTETPIQKVGQQQWRRAKQLRGLFPDAAIAKAVESAAPSQPDIVEEGLVPPAPADKQAMTATQSAMPATGPQPKLSARTVNFILLGVVAFLALVVLVLLMRDPPAAEQTETVAKQQQQEAAPANTAEQAPGTRNQQAANHDASQTAVSPTEQPVKTLAERSKEPSPDPRASIADTAVESAPTPATTTTAPSQAGQEDQAAPAANTQTPAQNETAEQTSTAEQNATDTPTAADKTQETGQAEATPPVTPSPVTPPDNTPPVTPPPGTSPGTTPPTHPPTTTPPAKPSPAQQPPLLATPQLPDKPPLPWADVSKEEQNSLTQFTEHESWTYRCFGLMRSERFSGEAVDTIVKGLLQDQDWHVRCFAVRAAVRRGMTLSEDHFKDEDNGHVLRTALRLELAVPGDTIDAITKALRRERHVESHLLACEIDAAQNDAKRLRTARSTLTRFIGRMKDDLAFILGDRLKGLTGTNPQSTVIGFGVHPQDGLAKAWRDWLKIRGRHDNLFVKQSRLTETKDAALPPIALAELDATDQVYAYLDTLSSQLVEIAICFDATGSMTATIAAVQQQINQLVQVLTHLTKGMRASLIAFRDGNGQLYESLPMGTDVDKMRTFLARVRASGGAGFGGVIFALEALTRFKWTREAVRQIVIIGDAEATPTTIAQTTGLIDKLGKQGFIYHLVATAGNPWASIEATALKYGGRSVASTDNAEIARLIMSLSLDEALTEYFEDFYDIFVELCL